MSANLTLRIVNLTDILQVLCHFSLLKGDHECGGQIWIKVWEWTHLNTYPLLRHFKTKWWLTVDNFHPKIDNFPLTTASFLKIAPFLHITFSFLLETREWTLLNLQDEWTIQEIFITQNLEIFISREVIQANESSMFLMFSFGIFTLLHMLKRRISVVSRNFFKTMTSIF